MNEFAERASVILPKLESVRCVCVRSGDLLVVAPGFEERTSAFVQVLRSSGCTKAVLLDYRPTNRDNKLGEVSRLLEKAGVIEIATLVYDRFGPEQFEGSFRDYLIDCSPKRVIVDISTMSKLALMIVLGVCRTTDVDLEIWYAEAAEYRPTEEEFQSAKATNEVHRPSLQIYTGVHGVVRVESLSSVSMQGQPTAAVAFMSFHDVLTQALLNTVYPARLFLINGRPPKHSWREEAMAWIHDKLRDEWKEDNPVRMVPTGSAGLPKRVTSTLDYRETVVVLLRLYWELSASHRMLVAPSGSKMQTVACSFVKFLHPDIHMEYPSAQGFVKEYSFGIGEKWRLRFPRFRQLIEEFGSIERRERLEVHV